jgi:hypothetical protein
MRLLVSCGILGKEDVVEMDGDGEPMTDEHGQPKTRKVYCNLLKRRFTICCDRYVYISPFQ